MPLIIDGQRCPRPDINLIPLINQKFQSSARRLKSIPAIAVDPQEPYLYIHQSECACVSADDPQIRMIGIDDMTTCCSAIISHTGSKAMGAGHFDENDTKNGLELIINGVKALTEDWAHRNSIDDIDLNSRYKYEIHLIGGFEDGRCISIDVITQILEGLNESNTDLHLKTACLFDSNTYYRDDSIRLPCITGLVCDVKSGQILPASFLFQGPLEEIRRLRFATRSPILMHLVYSSLTRILEISPFELHLTDDTVDQLIGLNTNSFLHYWSTSPLAEKPSFVRQMKTALKFLKDNRASLFCSGKSYKFVRQGCQWELVK